MSLRTQKSLNGCNAAMTAPGAPADGCAPLSYNYSDWPRGGEPG